MATLSWSRYLLWLAGALLATLLACGGVNAFMDPQGIFGSPRIKGVNAIKPYLDHHRELARWKGAQRLCPTAGIFGNSRAEIGFDPEHPAFAARGLRAYNHAIPGTSVSTAVQQLEWLRQAECKPGVIILGVEFIDFIGAPPAPTTQPPLPYAPSVTPAVLAETTFSLTGVRDALDTLLAQHTRYPTSLTEKGFNPLLNYIPEVAHNGHYPLFRQRASENAAKWLKMPRHIQPAGGVSTEWANLGRFLALAGDAEVHLVIYPYHAQLRLLMHEVGFDELLSQWKSMLLAVSGRHAKVKVWDFSGISEQTRESIPSLGDRRTQLTFYWEGGHFKRELGDLMLAQMLGAAPGFGVRLTPEGLTDWLAQDQRQLKALIASDAALRTEVDSIVKQAKQSAAPSVR